MARAIVRFSLQKGQVPLRNDVRQALEDAGFSRIGTSSFEAEDIELVFAAASVIQMLQRLGQARLDHVWIYIDNAAIAG